ncbi:MAG: hypothetical protein ABI682_06070 [Acidobacteriota bacterium]
MRYHWTECPGCRCQVAINTTSTSGAVTGSLRRWSTDRSVNDGRAIVGLVPDATGGFVTECVCGQALTLGATADAVGSERGE